VTDAEWQASTDSVAMLQAVCGRATERKLRLFACALGRLVWDRLPDGLLREVVEAGEQAADRLITDDNRQAYIDRLYAPWGKGERPATWFGGPPWGQETRDDWALFLTAKMAVAPGQVLARLLEGLGIQEGSRLTGVQQPGLLRDIVGPSPSGPPAFSPGWRTAEAVALAEHIYQDRAFDRLCELADILAAAECTDAEVLGHCRSEGPHARGCWVVDLVLGKV
jgi:hypothetical protein